MNFQGSRTATATTTMTQRQQKRTVSVYKCLLAVFIVLFTIKGAIAVSIIEINAPTQIYEGGELHISFTTDTTASYRILENGIEVSTTNNYSVAMTYDSAGLYTYSFEAIDANGTVTENQTIEVIDVPLMLTIQEPSESDYAISSIPVEIETNIAVDVCYTVTESGTNTLGQNSATHYQGSLTLADGVQIVEFKCNRNGEIAVEERTLKIDTTPPSMSLGPSGNVDDEVILTATTNEASDCRYGKSDQSYDDLSKSFSESMSLTHTEEISPKEGSNTYYVACRDALGNTAATLSTTFTLREKPTAKILVQGNNPHKAGSYDFTLETSEPLREKPTLSLSYQGGSTETLVLSEVDDTTYEGVLIISETAGEQVATFNFKGYDLSGLEGTEIEEGELFLVDTIKPGKVETFRAINGTGGVNLSWYYEGDAHFNIYRTDGLGVEYTDLLTTTFDTSYLDKDTTTAVRYYYRVAAVDDAGNVGPLSHEEWASPAAAKYAASEIGKVLDPVLQIDLDARIAILERLILDAQRTAKDLQDEKDTNRAWLIARLGLDADASRALKYFKDAKNSLESLRNKDYTAEEFEQEVLKIQTGIDENQALLAVDIAVENQAQYDEAADSEAIDAAITQALRGKVVEEGELEAYTQAAKALQNNVRISTTATIAKITYGTNKEQEIGIIEKYLIGDGPQADIIAVDMLPRVFSTKKISFLDVEPVKLEDTVYQYNFDSLLDEKISYAITDVDSLPTLRQGLLVPLPKPGVIIASSDNAITGQSFNFLSLGSSSQNLVLIFGIIIVIGLAAYYLSIRDEPLGSITQTDQRNINAGPSSLALAPAPVTNTVLVHRKHEPLVGLLLHGHELADETRYLDALHFYRQALSRFDEERFSSKKLRESIREELVLLHAKLSLLETMSKAHDACYVGDTAYLESQMRALQEHATTVGDSNSKLLEKAKTEYGYFYNKLDALRLESQNELLRESEVVEQPL